MKRVYIHADPGGTYLGNGGFLCLTELSTRLEAMGYPVAFFDPTDSLTVEKWAWTGYPAPALTPWESVCHQPDENYAVITTWLYSWLNALNRQPQLFPHIRYWCSGEILRDEPRYDPVRQWLREHCQTIAINNPTFDPDYRLLDLNPQYRWTNWIRDLFHANPRERHEDWVGYQPDDNGYDIKSRLQQAFGQENVVCCTGTQAEVAHKMRQCGAFLSWNKSWPLIAGMGESFGLSTYEAMASGCLSVARDHCGSLAGPAWVDTIEDALLVLREFVRPFQGNNLRRIYQQTMIFNCYRWNEARERAVRGYIDG
jgi:hypothetical protein